MQIQLWSRVFLTRFLTETSRDGAGGQGFREPVKTVGAGEMRRIGCLGTQGLWFCVLITRRSQACSSRRRCYGRHFARRRPHRVAAMELRLFIEPQQGASYADQLAI